MSRVLASLVACGALALAAVPVQAAPLAAGKDHITTTKRIVHTTGAKKVIKRKHRRRGGCPYPG